MSKYRVTFDALGDKTEKARIEITVENGSAFMATKIVEGRAKQCNATVAS